MEAIYRAFFLRLVRRVTWRFNLSKEDAAEVVQDAFVVALAKLDVEGNPIPWLYRTVDNVAANWKRKLGRRERLLRKWGGERSNPDSDIEGGEP